MTNRPRGLHLALDEGFERECPACVSVGTHEQDETIGGNCCGGTGRIKRRLVGMAEVELKTFSCGCLNHFEAVGTTYMGEPQEILAAHIAGDLPQELYATDDKPWGLREVDSDE